jgi:hypothetical protein
MLRLISRFFAPRMPARCFISHSYLDADLGYIDRLRAKLPSHVTPYVFPPIKVPPEQRVSDDLVKAVLSCPGLIYIDSPNSAESVWVSFERDLALRNRLPVFAFRLGADCIECDTGRPMPLAIFDSYSRRDQEKVHRITKFMIDERAFSVFDPRSDRHQDLSSFKTKLLTGSMLEILANGGYAVSFISRNAAVSQLWRSEQDEAFRRYPDRVLPVLLEPIDWKQLPEPLQRLNSLNVYQASDPARIDWNRVDDLVVRLYHMVYAAEKTRAARK